MVVRVTHSKVSGKPAGSDPARVYGTHWDEDHVIVGLTPGVDVQPHDVDLDALAALSSTGILARTADATYSLRTITGPAAGITVTNGDGVSGNPTLALANDLAAIEGLSSTGLAARTAADTWAQRTITGPAAGITVTNGDGVAGNPTLALANDLAALEGLSSNGMIARTATDTAAVRTITAGALMGVTNGDGVAGNPTIAVTDAELLAIGGLTSAADGLPYFTGSGTAALATFTTAGRNLVDDADATAQRATLGSTAVGDAVFIAANTAAARTAIGAVIGTDVQAFDSDLSALAANSTNGIWARTGTGTGAARTVTGTANQITVTNGDGVSGNPTLSLPSTIVGPGTAQFTSVAGGAANPGGCVHYAYATSGRTAIYESSSAISPTIEFKDGAGTPNRWAIGTGSGSTTDGIFFVYDSRQAATRLSINTAGVTNVLAATATPAGGSTAARLLFGTTAGFGIYYGSGAPTVSAAQGSLYIRSDGSSTSTRLYVNTNGTTGWTNFTSAT